MLNDLGDYDEAARHFERALAIMRGSLGLRQPVIAQIEHNLADLANQRREWAAAERHARTSLDVNLAVRGAENPATARSRLLLSRALREQHRFAEARTEVAEARAVMTRALPATHPRRILVDMDEAHIANLEGNWDDAVRLGRRAVAGLREHEGKPFDLAYAISSLATFVAHRAPLEALPLYEEALGLNAQQKVHDIHADVDELRELTEVALRAHKPAVAIRWFDRLPEAAKQLAAERAQLDRAAARP